MKDTKQKWFKEAAYGLFVHWGFTRCWPGSTRGNGPITSRNGS